jgi:hypothetical protein
MQNKKKFKNIRKILKPNFKNFKLQRFTDKKKTLILRKESNEFCKKPIKKKCLLPLCDLSKPFFFQCL